jgi:hypothetical protein
VLACYMLGNAGESVLNGICRMVSPINMKHLDIGLHIISVHVDIS